MLRSILIGLDGSAYSSAAVELGIRWARRFDALLVGLGIVDEPTICKREPVPIGAGHYKVERDQHLLADARRRVEGFLEGFARRCDAEGVKYKVLDRCRRTRHPDRAEIQTVRPDHVRSTDLLSLRDAELAG